MNKFKIPKQSSRKQKGIKFPIETLDKIENVLGDTGWTFTDFVKDSIEDILNEIDLENDVNILKKGKIIQKSIRFEEDMLERINKSTVENGICFSSFVKEAVRIKLRKIETEGISKYKKQKQFKKTQRGVIFSYNMIERVETAIMGTGCTFAGFVRNAVETVLNDLDYDKMNKELEKHKSICSKFYNAQTIRFTNNTIKKIRVITEKTGVSFPTFVRWATCEALENLEGN